MEEFIAILKKTADIDSLYIEIPFDIEEKYKTKRAKVRVKFDDVEYRGIAVKMGLPCYIVGVNKQIRKKINKDAGDVVNVKIELDQEERKIYLPLELEDIFKNNKKAEECFNKLSYTCKKEYVNYILDAKKEVTKKERLKKLIIKLENNEKLK